MPRPIERPVPDVAPRVAVGLPAASADAATRVGVSGSDSNRGGLSVRTLAIASAASALATYLVPMIWRPGTIAAAAATPVIVALISEALSRPAEHVSQAGRLVRVPRGRSRGPSPDEVARRRRRLAVVTGLLGFLVAAVIVTTTELATGEAVSGGGQRTTLLGGESGATEQDDADTAPTPATEAPATTPPDATATPVQQTTPDPDITEGATPAPPAAVPEGTPTPLPSVTPGATPAPAAP